MKKWSVLVAVALALSCLLAGCSGGKDDSNPSGASGLTGWEAIKAKGTLIVGMDDTFAPMGFRDENNNLVGFDIDMAKAVGEILGVQIQFQPIDWDAKEMELKGKTVDVLWNGLSATPDRQEKMSLTKKYLRNRLVVMALDSNVKVDTVEDLKTLQIGTQAKSAALEVMQEHEAYDTFKNNISEYATYDEAILDMQAGRIQVIVVDEVLGEYKNTKRTDKMTICSFNFGDDYYAVGCRKEDADLAQKINEAFKTLIDNGKAAQFSNTWFGHNVVILEDYS